MSDLNYETYCYGLFPLFWNVEGTQVGEEVPKKAVTSVRFSHILNRNMLNENWQKSFKYNPGFDPPWKHEALGYLDKIFTHLFWIAHGVNNVRPLPTSHKSSYLPRWKANRSQSTVLVCKKSIAILKSRTRNSNKPGCLDAPAPNEGMFSLHIK